MQDLKSRGNVLFRRPRCRWEDTMRRSVVIYTVQLIELAQAKAQGMVSVAQRVLS
jgi:hypothetical protein